jgi:hypothetical protein
MCLQQRVTILLVDDHIDATTVSVEKDFAVSNGEDCVIFPHANIFAWVPFGSALTGDDVSRDDGLSTEFLDSTALSVGIATVSGGTLSLLMCHRTRPYAVF